jgi:ABC-type phosphate transport system permease subunit
MTGPEAFAITILIVSLAAIPLGVIAAIWESCEHQPRRRNRRIGVRE